MPGPADRQSRIVSQGASAETTYGVAGDPDPDTAVSVPAFTVHWHWPPPQPQRALRSPSSREFPHPAQNQQRASSPATVVRTAPDNRHDLARPGPALSPGQTEAAAALDVVPRAGKRARDAGEARRRCAGRHGDRGAGAAVGRGEASEGRVAATATVRGGAACHMLAGQRP